MVSGDWYRQAVITVSLGEARARLRDLVSEAAETGQTVKVQRADGAWVVIVAADDLAEMRAALERLAARPQYDLTQHRI
jgi:PHD/YefM family antitoxin component YafN of YafNO toxin-antitoxin module